MGAIKRHLEHVSVMLGYDGEINQCVMGYAEHVTLLEGKVLRSPLELPEIQAKAAANADPHARPELNDPGAIGRIDGIICLTLSDIIAGDVEDFDTNLSERLTGTNMLLDIHYSLIGVDVVNDKLYFRVEGDPSMILESSLKRQ